MAQNTNTNGVLDTGSHHVIKVRVYVQFGLHVDNEWYHGEDL